MVSDSVRNTLVSDLLSSVWKSFGPGPNLSGSESGSDGRISGSGLSIFGLSGSSLSGFDLSGFGPSGSGLSVSGSPGSEPSDAGRSGLRPADSGLSGSDLSEAASSLFCSVLSGSDSGNPGSDDSVSGLSDLLPSVSALSAAARESFLPAGSSGGTTVQTVQAPVNIHVTAAAASPEAVARSVYDLSQRSLLKTLKGVFAG